MSTIRRVKRRNGLSHGFIGKVGAKIGDLHAKYSNSFCKRLITYTVGGNQARLDARTEFKILEPSPKGRVEASRAPSCTNTLNFLFY